MENVRNYVVDSLELHLFFARIMKEHSFFLKVGFLPPGEQPSQEGEYLLRQFEMVLSRSIELSDCVVRNKVLESGEIVTPFTERAECQSEQLTGTCLDRRLTARELRLKGQDCLESLCLSPEFVCQVKRLNRDALAMVNHIIHYKERLLDDVGSCRLFTVNYPLLIEHILREARLYRAHIMRLEGVCDCSCQELRDSELFWNQIMMEHALFIRGLLDPTEADLINTANDFAADYSRLLETSAAANDRVISKASAYGLTQRFRDFKQTGTQGIEACQIRSIILPLLADHVLREANHYLRLLEES